MRRHRLDVETVGKGTECGLVLDGWADLKPGDRIQCIRKARAGGRTDGRAGRRKDARRRLGRRARPRRRANVESPRECQCAEPLCCWFVCLFLRR